MNASTKPAKRTPPPIVWVTRARCPNCDSADLQTRRSTQSADGSTARNTLCRECGETFLVVVE